MKFRKTIVLVLSAVLIVLGALLPAIVGKQRDAADDGEIFFATINDIQLEFAESDVTLRETIAILCGNPETVEIPEDLASLKREEVVDIALDMAEQYREAGLAFQSQFQLEDVIDIEIRVQYSQPILASSSTVDNQSNIFWMVDVCSDNRDQLMSLIIDDRTGTVCSVDYSDENADYDKNAMKNVIYAFSGVYLDELGEEFYSFDQNDILNAAKSPTDNSYLASEISWWSGDYEYRTTFFVNIHGFYTYQAVVSY